MLAGKTVAIGVALIVLGVAGYVASSAASPTALIPAAFGAALAVLGWLAYDERRRKTVMHLAVAVGLVGFLGSVRGLLRLADWLSGSPVERPLAAVSQSLMAALTGVFVGLCVKSFIDARRPRREA
ncbi:MAG: hypothetical protein RMK57_10795 [Bryobacterales bacterium]|nr:hypothetical protein [Bryobacteraceae bacterium]MDW8355005.1 hypothetical protein [Bryobacterales bacterium]